MRCAGCLNEVPRDDAFESTYCRPPKWFCAGCHAKGSEQESIEEAALNLPDAVKHDSRICFGINFYRTEEDAQRAARVVQARRQTYNGGFFDGMACGREPHRDYVDPVLGKLFAVTI